MAILDAETYSTCKKCSNAEFIIEERCLLKEKQHNRSKTYIAETYKAIVCSKCGEVYNKIQEHDCIELITV